ncbi:MAG: macrolide transporter subunit MacA [Geobacteraceae bacterium]|nr:macrolide transporter subunit MacA [Geobacteraceae bacterium]
MKSPIRRQYTLLLIFLVIIAISAFTMKHFFFNKEPVSYITAEVRPIDLEESVLAHGSLQAIKTVAVGAQVSGQLKKLHVALGDRVQKGDLLAEIDPILQQNSLRDAEAALENVLAQKKAKQALLIKYQAEYQRQKQMIAAEASSRANLESASAQQESTRAEIAALTAQIKQAKISIDTARANLGYTRITAPMSGVVLAIVTEEGQTVVSAQTATTILKLANLDTMTVKAEISEADVTKVKPGQKVYFTILGDPDRPIYSTLRAVEPAPVDSTSSTDSSSSGSSSSGSAIYYNGLFEVPNPDHRLRDSMTAQVSIVLHEAAKALCIPVSALGQKLADGSYTVRVLKNNKPENRIIRIGVNNKVQVQVTEGLRAGETVIIGDSTTLPDDDSSKNSRPAGPPPGM